MNHSPIPWEFFTRSGTNGIRDCNGEVITDDESYENRAPEVRDMQFITRAANHHEELLESLQNLTAAATLIKESWEHGDLAAAVQCLMSDRNAALGIIERINGL